MWFFSFLGVIGLVGFTLAVLGGLKRDRIAHEMEREAHVGCASISAEAEHIGHSWACKKPDGSLWVVPKSE